MPTFLERGILFGDKDVNTQVIYFKGAPTVISPVTIV